MARGCQAQEVSPATVAVKAKTHAHYHRHHSGGTPMPSAQATKFCAAARDARMCVLRVELPSYPFNCRLEIWDGTLFFGKYVHP